MIEVIIKHATNFLKNKVQRTEPPTKAATAKGENILWGKHIQTRVLTRSKLTYVNQD